MILPKVCFQPATSDACGLYRMWLPHTQIKGSSYLFMAPDEDGKPRPMDLNELCDADVAVVQRLSTRENIKAIGILKQLKMKVIYDLDDNVWNMSADNPAKPIFEIMREGFGICAQLCDMITVSTNMLKKTVEYNLPKLTNLVTGKTIPVKVIPNGIDFDFFRKPRRELKDDNKVVIGWAGSNTHDEDFRFIWDSIYEVLESCEEAHFELVGSTPPKKLEVHPKVKVRQWVPVAEYPSRLSSWAWDITLAPLDNNRFNKSKSNIKILESAAIGAPCLVSDVQAYSEFCNLREELKWLLCFSNRHWKEKLPELVKSAELRNSYVTVMNEVAHEHFGMHVVKKLWEEALLEVMA